MTKKYFVIVCFLIIISLCGYFTLMSLSIPPLVLQEVDARCPNGYHKSPSGDCEKVTDTKGMTRCPNGYHRSPDGDCERVSKSSGSSNRDKTPEKDDDSNSDNNKYFDFTNTKNTIEEKQQENEFLTQQSSNIYEGLG